MLRLEVEGFDVGRRTRHIKTKVLWILEVQNSFSNRA